MQPGDVIAERFEIEALAGQGGMGAVYKARDRVGERPVALKVMMPGPAALADRFDREALALATLDHPGIVRFVAHGRTLDQRAWLAMEWLDGEDLSDRLSREGIDAGDALDMLARVASALSAAHERNIVHRDLKPGNLFLVDKDPRHVKVLDFGIARMGFSSLALTRPGQALGTPAYMAPEQAKGERDISPAADLWSLGVVLFECIAGRAPFGGDLAVAILAKVLLEDAPRLASVVPTVPAELDALVASLLQRDARQRPVSATDVAEALRSIRVDAAPRPARAPSTLPRSITGAEQELIAVILAVEPQLSTAPTAVAGAVPDTRVDFDPPTHGEVQRLVDGSSMVVLRGAGHAIDLAARAARAALTLRERLGPAPRIALAMGRAQVHERVPAGEVVDRAAALASEDGPPRILLDELTTGLLPTRFQRDTQGDRVCLTAEREGEDAVRTLLGQPTPCVGRKKELRMLGAIVDEAFEETSAQAALLIGPAGSGKTRLRQELVRTVLDDDPEVEVWIGRGDPVAAGSSFGLLTRALAGVLGLREGDPLPARRERIRARVAQHVPEDQQVRVAEFLGELLGAPFEAQSSVQLRAARADLQLMGDQLRRAVLDWLAAETAAHPLLLVLEDLQWGDLPTLSLLQEAMGRLHERPFMLLATARPDVDPRFATLWEDNAMERLQLSPLSRRAAQRLARHVLDDRTEDAVVDRIVARAGGNAFFLEELLRAEAEGRGSELPATLVAVAQARFEAIEPAARRILRAASVTGLTFWPGCTLAIVGGATDTPQLDAWLETLTRAEILEPRPQSRFAGHVEFAFRQDVMREAAYRSLTDGDRETAHHLAATWLEAAGEHDAVTIAEHYERGGQPAQAAGWWIGAAAQALEGNDLDVARAHAARGIAAGAQGELLGRAHLVRCEAASWQLDYEPALDAADAALETLTPGSAGFFEAASVGVACTQAMGRHDDTDRFVDALRRASRDLAPAAAARALATTASHLLYAGKPVAAEAMSQAAREAAQRCGNDAAVLGELALLSAREAAFRGDTGEYATSAAAARTLFEAAGDLRRTLNQHSNFGYALLELGRLEDSERELTLALERAAEANNSRVVAFARHNLGLVLARLGRLDEAVQAERTAIDELRAAGHARLEAGSRIYLALILRLAGDLAGAHREALAAIDQLRDVSPPLLPLARATLASVLLARGDNAQALDAAREAMGGEGEPIEAGESLVRLTLAEALHASGATAEATDAIVEARSRLLERAARIRDESYRRSFLEGVPENARTLELAARWAAD